MSVRLTQEVLEVAPTTTAPDNKPRLTQEVLEVTQSHLVDVRTTQIVLEVVLGEGGQVCPPCPKRTYAY